MTALNGEMMALDSKAPDDIYYIKSFLPRINDFIGSGQSGSILDDITFMITFKGILSGAFGYANMVYIDKPSGSDWGYVEYFKHADNFVTVKTYPEDSDSFYIGRFVIGDSTWFTPWRKVKYDA